MSKLFSGEGPGIQTPDGCSVDLYRQMPYMGELEDIIELLVPGTSVLELGCGTGRLCARLAEVGCAVTGVDESAEMLALLPAGVESVRSKVEDLDLRRTYDAVLLASHLINHPDTAVREAFVHCARRHLQAGGLFLLKRHSVDWLQSARLGPAGHARGVAVSVEAISRDVAFVHMTLRYELLNQIWRQSFVAVALSEAQIEQLLAEAGFGAVRWQGQQSLWASAIAGPALPRTGC